MRVSSILPLFFLLALPALAQRSTVSPTVLYPGENVITLKSEAGIQRVTVEESPEQSGRYEVRKTGKFGDCPTSTTIEFTVNTASESVRPVIVIEKCDGSAPERIAISLNTVWNLDEVLFPDAMTGVEVCRPFQIRLDGIGLGAQGVGAILDSVTSPVPGVSFLFTASLPVEIPRGTTYLYNVCFSSPEPGVYRIPIVTWIRREQPAGGYTTYPVADTGVVRVLPPGESLILRGMDLSGIDTAEGQSDPQMIDPGIADSLTFHGVDSAESLELSQTLPFSPTSATSETSTLRVVLLPMTKDMVRKRE